jgi:hypothetical protein
MLRIKHAVRRLAPLVLALAAACADDPTRPEAKPSDSPNRLYVAGIAASDGEYLNDGKTISLAWGQDLWGFQSWDTYTQCTGGATGIARQVTFSSPVTYRAIPTGSYIKPVFAAKYNDGDQTIFAVVGCVAFPISSWSTFTRVFGASAYVHPLPRTTLDAFPRGPVLETVLATGAPIRAPGTALIVQGGWEVRVVTHVGKALVAPSQDRLWNHCLSVAVDVDGAEFYSYGIPAQLPPTSQCTGASPGVVRQPDFRLPLKAGQLWAMTKGAGAYLHTGNDLYSLDFAPRTGTDTIYAPAGGTVTYKGWNEGGYGNYVDVTFANGFKMRFAHLRYASMRNVNDVVSRGQPIGIMGNTGNVTSSTGGDGTHLHLTTYYNGGSSNATVLDQVRIDGPRIRNFVAGTSYISTN